MAPSCTLKNGIKLEHPNPPSALRWWFQQLIPALCHECRRVIRAEHFDDPAAPFLCNSCLKKLPWFEPQSRCPYCGLEIEPGSKTPCSHGVSRTWHLDRLRSAFFTGRYSRTGFFPLSSEAGSLSHSCSDGFSPWG